MMGCREEKPKLRGRVTCFPGSKHHAQFTADGRGEVTGIRETTASLVSVWMKLGMGLDPQNLNFLTAGRANPTHLTGLS